MPCREEKCSEVANYNYKGESVKYCSNHSTVDASTGTDGMISNSNSFCIHDILKSRCFDCNPNSNYFCKIEN